MFLVSWGLKWYFGKNPVIGTFLNSVNPFLVLSWRYCDYDSGDVYDIDDTILLQTAANDDVDDANNICS